MKVFIITNDVDIARRMMYEEICREWQQTAPEAVRSGISPSRVLTTIAMHHGMSMQNVDKILRRAGLYQGARHYRRTIMEEDARKQEEQQS